MSAPKRLLEDPETAAALRSDLHSVASHQVNFDLAAGIARFEASLAAGSGAAGSGAAGSEAAGSEAAVASLKATLLKLGMAGVVAGGAVLGIALYSSNEPDAMSTNSAMLTNSAVSTPPPSPAIAPAVTRAATPAAPSAAETVERSDAAEPPVEPVKRATARPAAKARQLPAASSTETRDDLLQREIQNLRQIRQLVSANPGQALALANEGHSTFKGGVLYQEREALALQALSALGRRSELEARGDRYLRAFPNGSFSNRIRQLLGR